MLPETYTLYQIDALKTIRTKLKTGTEDDVNNSLTPSSPAFIRRD